MSRIHPPTRAGKIAMFREQRAKAGRAGDGGMVRCMDVELARLGVSRETGQERPRRGRKPMARCEHDAIEARCELCHPDLAA
jgi:hypothetical protein